jgi:hypothetical protein
MGTVVRATLSDTRLSFSGESMNARHIRRSLLAAAAALSFGLAHAAAPQDTAAKNEIDHLLNYIAASSCTFIRNGSEFPADKARDHLAGKYRFAGSRVSTAEDFIKYLATQSSMSGAPYHVRCGNTDALSGTWLTTELNRYRKAPKLQTVAR